MIMICGQLDQAGNKCVRAKDHTGQHLRRGGHKCHWPVCNKPIAPNLWGCKEHWFKLPQHLRDRIWATYRPGQEIQKNPSIAYIKAAQQVQDWIENQS